MVSPVLAELLAAPASRDVVRQLLHAVGESFTRTSSVRDVLPDTAPESPEQALSLLAGIDHLRSMIAEIDATWQVNAEQRLRAADAARDVAPDRQGRATAQEMALARRVSPASSSFSLASARRLVIQMPHLRAALAGGRVTEEQVREITRSLNTAEPEAITQIDEALGYEPGRLDGLGRRRVRDLVHEMVHRISPGGARERAERAARGRHVTCTSLPDGMARVSATIRALDAAAIMTSLRTRAQADKAAGDRTAVQCLEADHLVRGLLTAPSSRSAANPIRIEVGVVLTDRALLAGETDGASALIDGYGIVPADVVTETLRGRPPGHIAGSRPTPLATTSAAFDGGTREAAEAAAKAARRTPGASNADPPTADPPGMGAARSDPIDTDPVDMDPVGTSPIGTSPSDTGPTDVDPAVEAFVRKVYAESPAQELTDADKRSRAFSVGVARLVRWSDRTCRTPFCNAAIRHIDHITPYAQGGPTSRENAQGLCARCNQMKEHGDWTVRKRPPESGAGTSRIHWTSPHGATGSSPAPAAPGAPAA